MILFLPCHFMYVPTWLGIYAILVLIAGAVMHVYSLTRDMPQTEEEYRKIRRKLNIMANLAVFLLFSVPVLVAILWIAGMIRG